MVIFASLFKWRYPEVQIAELSTVIPLLGFIAAFGNNIVINRIKKTKQK